MPGLAIAAGALGLIGCVPLGFVMLVLVAFSTDSGTLHAGPLLLLLVPILPLVGAILLLCRRGWWFFLVSCLPGALVWFWFLFQAGEDPSELWGPQTLLLCPVVALGCALPPRVRRWVRARRRF